MTERSLDPCNMKEDSMENILNYSIWKNIQTFQQCKVKGTISWVYNNFPYSIVKNVFHGNFCYIARVQGTFCHIARVQGSTFTLGLLSQVSRH